MADLTIEALV